MNKLEYNRQWKKNNSEKVTEARRIYYRKHKQDIADRYRANANYYRVCARKYYRAHRQRMLQLTKESKIRRRERDPKKYRSEHNDAQRKAYRKRKENKKMIMISILSRLGSKCQSCGTKRDLEIHRLSNGKSFGDHYASDYKPLQDIQELEKHLSDFSLLCLKCNILSLYRDDQKEAIKLGVKT